MSILDRCRVCDGFVLNPHALQDPRERHTTLEVSDLDFTLGMPSPGKELPKWVRDQRPDIKWELDLKPEFAICFCRRDLFGGFPSRAGQ